MRSIPAFRHLSDAELLAEAVRLAQRERDSTVDLIVSLQEIDRRQLYLPAGYGSLFRFCTMRLGLSEGAAYARIEAARAAQRFPLILELLSDASITLATVGLISRHLTVANHLSLLNEVSGKTKREVECVVARLQPKPDVATLIRKLPTAAPVSVAKSPVDASTEVEAGAEPLLLRGPAANISASPVATRTVIAPLTPERFKFQITIDRETHDTLREIQDLIRHAVPSADPAVIVTRALKLFREHLLRQKAGQVRKPRPTQSQSDAARRQPGIENDEPPPSRQISAEVKRVVWKRDAGRCAFAGADGRCVERGFLEFHHVRPFAAGGEATADNLELRCRAHNTFEADLFSGLERGRPSRERRRA